MVVEAGIVGGGEHAVHCVASEEMEYIQSRLESAEAPPTCVSPDYKYFDIGIGREITSGLRDIVSLG